MTARVQSWLAAPLPAEVARAIERLSRSEDVARIAIMPDVHLSHEVCVGTVLASRSSLFPAAIGGDIGCGMAAMQLRGDPGPLRERALAVRLLREIGARVPALRHRQRQGPALPEPLASRPLSSPALERLKAREGTWEFATLGRGNHFLELQLDDAGSLWIMAHSGSRAIGQAVRDHHLRNAGGGPALASIPADSDAGRRYLADMEWTLEFAERSRRAIVDAAAEVVAGCMGLEPLEETYLACHHNDVREELHFGERLWVHRKGAISAQLGEPGIVPGSMGTWSFHVEGRGCADALSSSSHGAGRAMSRTEARRSIGARQFEREMRGIWFDERFTDRLREEAPGAYRDIREVMAAQRDLTKIVRRLRPLLAYKGG